MGNPFLKPETHAAIAGENVVPIMTRQQYLAYENVRQWENLVARAKVITEQFPGQVGVLIANAIELGRAKRDLELAHV